MSKFNIGDRVRFPKDVYNYEKGYLYGVIVNIYSKRSKFFGFYPELYSVLWDGETEPRHSYLPHGLESQHGEIKPVI